VYALSATMRNLIQYSVLLLTAFRCGSLYVTRTFLLLLPIFNDTFSMSHEPHLVASQQGISSRNSCSQLQCIDYGNIHDCFLINKCPEDVLVKARTRKSLKQRRFRVEF
jgi:hypothetical protein